MDDLQQPRPGEGTTRSGLLERISPREVAIALAAAAIIWFAVDNTQSVTIDWWVTDRSSPLILVIIVSFALGAAVALLGSRRRRKRKERAAKG
ncbi:MAG: LapA family protein [Thermoleophilia bacterium]